MSGAVEAAGDVILLVSDKDDATIAVVDVPAIGWITGAPGAPAMPVINGTLPATWALCQIHRTWSPPELIGSRAVSVREPGGWAGSFAAYLDRLVAATGKGISGTALADAALGHAFGTWLGDRYGGMTFRASA